MVKRVVSDLACFGGKALFHSVKPIGQLSLPNIERFYEISLEILTSRRFTNIGPVVHELEQRLCQTHAVEHCITFANASVAIISVLDTLAKHKSGEVIMPAFTYIGLPHLAKWASQTPRFCDVDPATHVIDPERVNAAIGESTSCILAVHQVNAPCNIERLQQIAKENDIPLVFDSVHAIFASYLGKPFGSFGACEIFSLHATKILNGFEGGYVTTNDSNLASALRTKRNFGFTDEGHTASIGINGKLNEVHAAMALACLDDIPSILDRNKRRVAHYADAFANIPGIRWVAYSEVSMMPNYEFALLHLSEDWPLSRNDVVRIIRIENALARGYYEHTDQLAKYFSKDFCAHDLPVTCRLAREFIQMPVGELVSNDDIERLAELFLFIYRNASEIKRRLDQSQNVN